MPSNQSEMQEPGLDLDALPMVTQNRVRRGVTRIDKNGVERYVNHGGSVEITKANGAKWRAENAERHKANGDKWYRENSDRKKATGDRWYRENHERKRATNERIQKEYSAKAFAIIGTGCAWANLGGCTGDMEKDHIVPPGARRTTGYTSTGASLNLWILANPDKARKRLQVLCGAHNSFKSDGDNEERQQAWKAKYPFLCLEQSTSGRTSACEKDTFIVSTDTNNAPSEQEGA